MTVPGLAGNISKKPNHCQLCCFSAHVLVVHRKKIPYQVTPSSTKLLQLLDFHGHSRTHPIRIPQLGDHIWPSECNLGSTVSTEKLVWPWASQSGSCIDLQFQSYWAIDYVTLCITVFQSDMRFPPPFCFSGVMWDTTLTPQKKKKNPQASSFSDHLTCMVQNSLC